MRDLLTTVASMIVILFFLSMLLMGEERFEKRTANPSSKTRLDQEQNKPAQQAHTFHKVQSVKLERDVLKFVTLEQEGLKEHYFLIRDKNVILVNHPAGKMSINTLRFEIEGNLMRITIPPAYEIDFMESLTLK